jgi:hypothetical protein
MGAETERVQDVARETAREGGFTPRQVRLLKASVVIMGVLIVACLLALVAGLYYQANKPRKNLAERNNAAAAVGTAALRSAPVTLKVRAGSAVEDMTAGDGLLILRFKTPEGGEIAILSLKSGEEIRRIILKPE